MDRFVTAAEVKGLFNSLVNVVSNEAEGFVAELYSAAILLYGVDLKAQ